MAAADATVFPPKNTAYRLAVAFRKNDGSLITGWTGAASVIVTDAGAAGAGATPTEVGSSGLGYLDLTAGQMNGALIEISCSVTNTSAIPFIAFVYTNGVTQMTSGLATAAQLTTAQTTIIAAIPTASVNASAVWNVLDFGSVAGRPTNLGGQVAAIFRYLFNKNQVDKNLQTQTLFGDDNTTILVSGSMLANSQLTTKGKLS